MSLQREDRFEESQEYRLGRWAEDLVAAHVLAGGGFVLNTRDIQSPSARIAAEAAANGRAALRQAKRGGPALKGLYREEKLTDMIAFYNGAGGFEQRQIEVKCKTIVYDCARVYGWRTHGISKYLFESYGKLQGLTGIPVWIAFVCRQDDDVRWARYDELAIDAQDGGWFQNNKGQWCRMMHVRHERLRPWFGLGGQWYAPPSAQAYTTLAKPAPPKPPIPVRIDAYGQTWLC